MSLTRVLPMFLALCVHTPTAWAQGKDDDDEEAVDEDESEEADDAGDDGDDEVIEAESTPPPKKPSKKNAAVKQNLSGHDMGNNQVVTPFEKDRFFIDKADTKKTAKATLIQGSLSSSTMFFTERGGYYPNTTPIGGPTLLGTNSARYNRMFTELRLQTDFRHISASKWNARADVRARVVNSPGDSSIDSTDPTRVQSGFNGTNEYELRELWLHRSGTRTDFYFGRQFISDLGAIRFDGLRFDYAKSKKLTIVGFGGLYPVRGSRSITTDYLPLKDIEGNPAGRFVGTGGLGVAYRTENAYGSIGGATLVPFAGESPRVFVTSTGYYRNAPTFDVYHFVLLDLLSSGSQDQTRFGITNVSVGINYHPNPRLRINGAVNRIDVDTLNVQAAAFLDKADDSNGTGQTAVQNETFFRRLATNEARASVSAGLGQAQRFEVTAGGAFRMRDGVRLFAPGAPGMAPTVTATLDPTKGVEVFAGVVDRRSLFGLRIGADVSRMFAIGIPFQRSEVLVVRGLAGREIAKGRGEWEAEVSYAGTVDRSVGIQCFPDPMDPTNRDYANQCLGASQGNLLSVGGTFYYRINRDWFAMATAHVSRQTLVFANPQVIGGLMPINDPTVTGMLGYLRVAYRF
ncbi:MAG: hypothetical protein AB7O24_26005 [Kofleriaceae bacterium]